jgi:hypothetical protein
MAEYRVRKRPRYAPPTDRQVLFFATRVWFPVILPQLFLFLCLDFDLKYFGESGRIEEGRRLHAEKTILMVILSLSWERISLRDVRFFLWLFFFVHALLSWNIFRNLSLWNSILFEIHFHCNAKNRFFCSLFSSNYFLFFFSLKNYSIHADKILSKMGEGTSKFWS